MGTNSEGAGFWSENSYLALNKTSKYPNFVWLDQTMMITQEDQITYKMCGLVVLQSTHWLPNWLRLDLKSISFIATFVAKAIRKRVKQSRCC